MAIIEEKIYTEVDDGPLLYTVDDVAEFIAEAIAKEREACARLIDEQDAYGDPVYCWFEHLAAEIRARGEKCPFTIAAAIRARGDK